jgi:hypothetical protein
MTLKNAFPDNRRRIEYQERLRKSLVMEEYYKLRADHPDKDQGELLILASKKIRAKEE